MKSIAHLFVFAVVGSAVAATPIQPTLSLDPGSPNNSSGSAFGQSVAGIGDVNGDGYADFAVGQPGAGSGSTSRYGAVLVYYGSPPRR